ncbi:acyl-CoA dehydrogenase [Pseudarthrobacter sp. P1]|uniref:acyl-CoA dehydrogenase n=1 Tax=Pseudarthrobacter sp. P1 TaxID=3418418 RepID=UPI003CF37DB7
MRRVTEATGDPVAALALAQDLGRDMRRLDRPGFLGHWEMLATLGSVDLGVARIVEPHLDALNILDEADSILASDDDLSWGVFAAEGAGHGLKASLINEEWTLDGTKPWCSASGLLTRAVVTAHDGGERRTFAVDLRHPGVVPAGPPWAGRGLTEVPSGAVAFHRVPAVPIGAAGWYFHRPGFSWGGIGVAAVWHGAMVALARRLLEHCTTRDPDQIALMHLGMADAAIQSSANALRTAADLFRAPTSTHPSATAARTRAIVVQSVESVLAVAARGMGPAPLAFEPGHAKRVADLSLYLRQDHGERSLAGLGALLVAAEKEPW